MIGKHCNVLISLYFIFENTRDFHITSFELRGTYNFYRMNNSSPQHEFKWYYGNQIDEVWCRRFMLDCQVSKIRLEIPWFSKWTENIPSTWFDSIRVIPWAEWYARPKIKILSKNPQRAVWTSFTNLDQSKNKITCSEQVCFFKLNILPRYIHTACSHTSKILRLKYGILHLIYMYC